MPETSGLAMQVALSLEKRRDRVKLVVCVTDIHSGIEGRDRPCSATRDRTVRDVSHEYKIAETLYYHWRNRLLDDGTAALSSSRD